MWSGIGPVICIWSGVGVLYLAAVGTPNWSLRSNIPELGSLMSSVRMALDCVWARLLKLLGMYSGTELFFLLCLWRLAAVPSKESANWKDL